MKKENGFTKFLESNQVNAMVSILIIISLALLVVHKIIDFSVKTDKIFDSMDEVFLIFFSIEFLIKILYLRKKYFIHDLGWIDLLAALPVLTPLIKYLLLRFNVETFLVQETASITIVLRGFRFIRFLRILRTARLLRFFNYAKISNKLNERKSTFTIPVIFSMILLLLGYFLISSIETQLRTQKIYKMNNIVLPPERGFPFKLVSESKYGYKWIKWITEIELSTDADFKGYWETRGFSNDADIE